MIDWKRAFEILKYDLNKFLKNENLDTAQKEAYHDLHNYCTRVIREVMDLDDFLITIYDVCSYVQSKKMYAFEMETKHLIAELVVHYQICYIKQKDKVPFFSEHSKVSQLVDQVSYIDAIKRRGGPQIDITIWTNNNKIEEYLRAIAEDEENKSYKHQPKKEIRIRGSRRNAIL